MSNEENIAVDQLHDLINNLNEREYMHRIGLALQELGRRVSYRLDLQEAFADLKESDQDRVRIALSSLPQPETITAAPRSR